MQTQSVIPTMTHIPVSLIFKGNNPRKYFDQAELDELTASILHKGVIQPIVVRPVGDGNYTIIAGERRFRAAVAAHGVDYEIPAVIRDISEEEAAELALIENIQRADMSVTEEAKSAGTILERHKSREEAAAVLGWPLSKFNRRIGLLNLCEEVMTAVDTRRIMVGHGELLSALSHDKQREALKRILEHNLPVNVVKELLLKKSTEFSTAIFDQAGCAQCTHNSTRQASLFVNSIGDGRCTNQDCFEARTDERIEAIRAELAEEVVKVKLIGVGENGFTKLTAEGAVGIGQEQYDECKACANHGATVSLIPGSIGSVERSICFDTICHQKKVADRIRSEQKTQTPATETSQLEKGSATTKSVVKKMPATGKEVKVSALSQRVVEYRRKQVWERAAKKELAAQPDKAKAIVLDLLLTGSGSLVDREQLGAYFNKITGQSYPDTDRYSPGKVGHPEIPYSVTAEQEVKVFAAVAISAVSNTSFSEDRLKKILSFLDTDLTKHYTLDKELFDMLTKSEIEAVCVSVGLDGIIPDYKKVVTGKKDACISAILAAQFEFAGAVPSILNY